MTENEKVGWHHQLDGCEFEQTPGVGDGQGGLACCGSQGHKESDTTEQLNRTEDILRVTEMMTWSRGGSPVKAWVLNATVGIRIQSSVSWIGVLLRCQPTRVCKS